ncbi:MAG: DUF3883 domain-containing protein [Bacteroidetes bacterium]|nr:DUF3883 domain-containing protein [Bacteroidota bacterium]MBU2586271.1 DUF3883 domain-containing protein [Bacteroidota bacterium]
MIQSENCKHGSSAPFSTLQGLPESQTKTGRHKCTVCAFQKGFEDAQLGSPLLVELEQCHHKSSAPLVLLRDLPWSQAGAGRHKCATCAYGFGFEAGTKESTILVSLFSDRVDQIAHPSKHIDALLGKLILSQPPKFSKLEKSKHPSFKGSKIMDRSYRELKNIQLGRAGELLVMNYECEILVSGGRKDLAQKIIHVSELEGDGAGYDIKSFQLDGKTKYIEVKTTRGSANTPFFITWTELEFSKQNYDDYYLYRVFDFDSASNSGRLFVVQGKVNDSFNLSPTIFRGSRV